MQVDKRKVEKIIKGFTSICQLHGYKCETGTNCVIVTDRNLNSRVMTLYLDFDNHSVHALLSIQHFKKYREFLRDFDFSSQIDNESYYGKLLDFI